MGVSYILFLNFKCKVLLEIHIIKNFEMFRQRKKVAVDGKDRGKTVVVEEETDELEEQHESISNRQKGKMTKTKS